MREEKRQAILSAARETFRENGVEGTSMDALARRAGVSKRTVYNHFRSKEALVRELLSQFHEKARQRLHVKYQAKRPLEPQLLTLIGSEIALASDPEYLELARLAAGHFFYQPQKLHESAIELAAPETGLARWFEDAAADGRLVLDDAVFTASLVRKFIDGACLWPSLMALAPIPGPDEQRRIADEAVAMMLARYRPG